MAIVTLASLVSPATQADSLALELSIANSLGLQTSTWQPLDPSRTILQINAQVVSQYSVTVNLLAQGGYASYAAQMTDASGAPITAWMDLAANDSYNVPRIAATAAAGPVPYTNASAASYAYSPNSPLKFQNPNLPNATYTSTGSGTVTGSGSGTVNVIADAAFTGSAGTAAVGTTLILLTPKSGVTIGPQTVALVGAPQETNAALLSRCKSKLATLSSLSQLAALAGSTASVPAAPGGAPGAYDFTARTIPQASAASTVWPYAVTAVVTRTSVRTSGGGVVTVYVANASGSPTAGDVAAVNAAIQALCVPQAVSATVLGAANFSVNVTYTVYVRANGQLTATTIKANIATALANYFASLTIGGVFTSNPSQGIVPYSELVDVIVNANPGTVDLTLSVPAGNTNVPVGQVPVLGSVSGSVVQV